MEKMFVTFLMPSFLFFSLVVFITLILMGFSSFFSFEKKEVESNTPFECGMDPISLFRTPFYIHFLWIAILFLVFDVELSTSIPFIYLFMLGKMWNVIMMFFFFILLIGLLIEVVVGTIDWKE
nr:NADH dehydrogenase subunit 3 [Pessoaiella absita]